MDNHHIEQAELVLRHAFRERHLSRVEANAFVKSIVDAVKEDMTSQKGVEVVICWCWDDVGGHVKLCPVIREVDVQKELVRFEAGVFLRTYKDRQGTWHYVQTYPDGQDMPSRVEDSGA